MSFTPERKLNREIVKPTPELDRILKGKLGLDLVKGANTAGDIVIDGSQAKPNNTPGEGLPESAPDILIARSLPSSPAFEKLRPRFRVFESKLIDQLSRYGVAVFPMGTPEAIAFMMMQGEDRIVGLVKTDPGVKSEDLDLNKMTCVMSVTTSETVFPEQMNEGQIGFAIAGKEAKTGNEFVASPDLNLMRFGQENFDPAAAIRYAKAIKDIRAVPDHTKSTATRAATATVPLVTPDHFVGAAILLDDTLAAHRTYMEAPNPSHVVDNRKINLADDISSSEEFHGQKVGNELIWDPNGSTEVYKWGKRVPYFVVLLLDLVNIISQNGEGRIVLKGVDSVLKRVKDETGEEIDPLADYQRMMYAALVARGQAEKFKDEIQRRAERGNTQI